MVESNTSPLPPSSLVSFPSLAPPSLYLTLFILPPHRLHRLHRPFSPPPRPSVPPFLLPTVSRYVRDDGTRSPFSSIPESMWWCLVTMTTVGYGEPSVPYTWAGKLLAAMTSVTGILLLAVPISVISSSFQSQYHRMSTLQRIAHEQKGKLAHAHNIALQRQKEKETSGGGSSADKNSNKGKDDDGAHLEADIFLVSCFELIKFNQRKLLGRMKDTGLKNGACACGGQGGGYVRVL